MRHSFEGHIYFLFVLKELPRFRHHSVYMYYIWAAGIRGYNAKSEWNILLFVVVLFSSLILQNEECIQSYLTKFTKFSYSWFRQKWHFLKKCMFCFDIFSTPLSPLNYQLFLHKQKGFAAGHDFKMRFSCLLSGNITNWNNTVVTSTGEIHTI